MKHNKNKKNQTQLQEYDEELSEILPGNQIKNLEKRNKKFKVPTMRHNGGKY